MALFRVKHLNKTYKVKAKDGLSAVLKLKDELSGLEEKVKRYAQAVADYMNRNWDKDLGGRFDYIPKISKGPKYYKIAMTSCGQTSVFAFVDMDGNVYKAASCNAPASGIRGHIDTIDPRDTLYRYR